MARKAIGEKYNEKLILKEGEEFAGFYVGSHEATVDGDDLTFHTFERQSDGRLFDILETSVLASKIKEVKPGVLTYIRFLGDLPSKKRKGKTFKNFSVEIDEEIKKQ